MDGDPGVEPELDSFSLTLPLPYRVALVSVLGMRSGSWIFFHLDANCIIGVWAWGANLQYLSRAKIVSSHRIQHPFSFQPFTL